MHLLLLLIFLGHFHFVMRWQLKEFAFIALLAEQEGGGGSAAFY